MEAKIIARNDCLTRLRHAAINGSIVAKDILSELKKKNARDEVIRGTANFFSTKRILNNELKYTRVKICFTACNKDINNKKFPDRGNPQAPWLQENRCDLEPSTFVGLFKNLPEYSNQDMEFFCSAIILNSVVTVKILNNASDFFEAYYHENYSPTAQYGQTSLHSSCMRYEDMAKNVADFYTNFVHARIIVAKDSAGNVLGRAIVWPKTYFTHEGNQVQVSVLDRIYYSHLFVIDKIVEYAEKAGINFRKESNDSCSPTSFEVLNPVVQLPDKKGETIFDISLCINTRKEGWHKGGTPFLDTFSFIKVTKNMHLELSNILTNGVVATAHATNGFAERSRKICPSCGKIHNEYEKEFCTDCSRKIFKNTKFGTLISCKYVEYSGETYPDILFRKGKPIPAFRLYNQINQLCV